MIRTCSSSHCKIHRLDTFRPNSSLANYPQSNRTYRQLSRRQPHSTTLLPRFFRIRRVPRIPLVKLRRRAERKFLVPNSSLSLSLVKVSFDLGIPLPRHVAACSSSRSCESPICTYLTLHTLFHELAMRAIPCLFV